MFDECYIHISDTLAVGPVYVDSVDDVRRLIYSHPKYDNQAMIASVMVPGDSIVISLTDLQGAI